MAATLEVHFSRKRGEPEFSSRQASLTLRVEISDLTNIHTESDRLFGLVRECVDAELENYCNTGDTTSRPPSASGHGRWIPPTEAQLKLIDKVCKEHKVHPDEIESLVKDRFGCSLDQIQKLQASSLIQELLDRYSKHRNSSQINNGTSRRSYARNGGSS